MIVHDSVVAGSAVRVERHYGLHDCNNLPIVKTTQRKSKMSDQDSHNPQHSDPQKPGSGQKPENQPNQPVQQKQQLPSGKPKAPASEHKKHDQEKKKQG
jgi:hypothetical protein